MSERIYDMQDVAEHDMAVEIRRLKAENEKLRAELREIVKAGDAISEWTSHGSGCPAGYSSFRCTCGLAAARAEYKQLTAHVKREE